MARSEFYSGCSKRGVLYGYRYNESNRGIEERRIFADAIYPGVPDGSTVDSVGTLWNCRYSGGCILGFSPTGELLHKIEMPTVNVTNCVFGDDDLQTLYVTSAALGASSNDPLAGNLFSLRMEVPGIAPYRFGLNQMNAADTHTI
jgi:sugar lactone lactonase YvrE